MYVLAYCTFIGAIILNFLIPNKKLYFGILFLLMAIIVGIRDPYTGTDTLMYYSFIDVVKREGIVFADQSNVNMELGFRILMFICGAILESSQSLIFISSVITYLLFARYLYKNSNEKYYYIAGILFIGMGFFVETMNTMRQLLALSIAINGLEYLKDNQYIKSIIIIILSYFIHSSMILLLILVIFYMMANIFVKKDGNNIVMFLSSLLFIMFIGINMINIINNNIDLLGGYAIYYAREEYSNVGSGGWSRAIGIFIVTLVYSFFRFNKHDRVYNMMLILGCEFALITIYFTNTWMFIFYRFYYEFFIFFIVLLINILKRINSPIVNICFQIFLIFISAIILYKQISEAVDIKYNIFF